MIVTPLQLWWGTQGFWGIDVLRIETDWDGRALFSLYHSRTFGWSLQILFIEVI